MKATTTISTKSYRDIWEKAVKYSMSEMEYVSKYEANYKPWWCFWKTEYTQSPFTDTAKYWQYMRDFYPWNEIDGFSSISRYEDERELTISVKLLAATLNRARKYDENQN